RSDRDQRRRRDRHPARSTRRFDDVGLQRDAAAARRGANALRRRPSDGRLTRTRPCGRARRSVRREALVSRCTRRRGRSARARLRGGRGSRRRGGARSGGRADEPSAANSLDRTRRLPRRSRGRPPLRGQRTRDVPSPRGQRRVGVGAADRREPREHRAACGRARARRPRDRRRRCERRVRARAAAVAEAAVNFTWLYVAALYAIAIAIVRRASPMAAPRMADGRSQTADESQPLPSAVRHPPSIPWRVAALFYALTLAFLFRPMTGPYNNVAPDILKAVWPWQQPGFDKYSVSNFELQDVMFQLAPWMQQVHDQWRTLHVPLWNDLTGCGMPLLANMQSAALSP